MEPRNGSVFTIWRDVVLDEGVVASLLLLLLLVACAGQPLMLVLALLLRLLLFALGNAPSTAVA